MQVHLPRGSSLLDALDGCAQSEDPLDRGEEQGSLLACVSAFTGCRARTRSASGRRSDQFIDERPEPRVHLNGIDRGMRVIVRDVARTPD